MTGNNLAVPDDCRPLFALMNQVRALAPWKWMEETDLFGVQHPTTGEIAFVSIMGMAGEHYAISAYQGAHGLYGFQHMQDMGPYVQPQDLLNTPQLQASFEDREMLDKHDLHLIKSLGLKYRGRQVWPQFRSYRPGYVPWYLERSEAQFLQYILEQVMVVAPRVQQQPKILDPYNDHHYLVRVPQRNGETLHWEDQILPVEKPAPLRLVIEVDPALLEAVKRLPREKYTVEADVFMLPTAIGEHGQRPYFPYMLMALDATHDQILGFDLLSPIPSLEKMWGQVGLTALKQLVNSGAMPTEIRVRDSLLYGMLMPFVKELKLKVKQVKGLPMLDRARVELDGFMHRR